MVIVSKEADRDEVNNDNFDVYNYYTFIIVLFQLVDGDVFEYRGDNAEAGSISNTFSFGIDILYAEV